ncbi:MAG: glutathione synthetase [Saprospiraceae bacterium]|nr:glutathione synthetase [Saprospiraceae bacterium]
MKKLKMLVLTDHQTHSQENSLYALLRELRKNPACAQVDVASRSTPANQLFFSQQMTRAALYASPVGSHFQYHPDGRCFREKLRRVFLREYDAIFLRLPHPIAPGFWAFLQAQYPAERIVNRPDGIERTSDKCFLLEVPHLCPPIYRCRSIDDILHFKEQFAIVLKPRFNYGGKGLVRIEGNAAWVDNRKVPLVRFLRSLAGTEVDYLGMKFLQNVDQGDKRVVVVNGQVLGASLRLPAKGSWLCNVAQGGHAEPTEPDADERQIAAVLTPILRQLGVVMYGFDTLMGDEGKRVLSEINTLSIGGLPTIAAQTGRPVVRQAADLIWEHVLAGRQLPSPA